MNWYISWEETIKNPHKGAILDFNYITTHPECKFQIMLEIAMNPELRLRIHQKLKNDYGWSKKFFAIFPEYEVKESTIKRK